MRWLVLTLVTVGCSPTPFGSEDGGSIAGGNAARGSASVDGSANIDLFDRTTTAFVELIAIPGFPNAGHRVQCPSIHSFTSTKTMLPNGDERHVVAWTPANEPGVIVSMFGDIENQLSKPDTGQHEWTQPARSGTRMAQVVRRIDLGVPPRSALQCVVRVRTTLS